MRKSRVFVAHAVILFIVGASFYDIIRDEEHWPFSQYPMFNRVNTSRDLAWLRLYGVTAGGDQRVQWCDRVGIVEREGQFVLRDDRTVARVTKEAFR